MLAWEITEENTRVLTRLLILMELQTRSHLPRASSSFIQSSHLLPLGRASLSSHLFTTIRGSSARSLSPLALGRDHGLESLESMQHSGELGSLACSAPHPLLLCLSMSKDVSLRKTLEVTRTSQYLKSHRIFSFDLVFVKSSLGLGFSVVLCFLQSCQRTASRKALGVGWSCSQSAGRAGTGVFNRHVRRSPLHTKLHNHRDAH